MVLAQQALTFALAKLADSRDPETGAHLYRVRDYCTLLAGLLAEHPKFRDAVTESFIENMYLVAPLHDIGKVAMPDGILLKQGKLTEAEFGIMVTHTSIGADALDTVLQFCNFEVFQMARRVIFCHHERYDGSGYPRGLKGEEIPVEARIMTLADIYDALLSKRVYKPPMGYEEVRERMAGLAGTHLDPDMTKVMIEHMEKFEEIHRNYTEHKPDEDDLVRT
jgi:putative two-component system response regulator